MKTIVIFLQIYILSVSCSPNLNYNTNSLQSLLVDPNASETGKVGTTSGMMVLYPNDTYSVPDSVYSDTTVAKINGVEVETSKGENGEIVVHIPSGLDNGKITIELTNSEDSLTIDNVFHLNDPSIPLFSGDASFICSGMQFYNANGVLTTGTKNCSGPADCTTDGEVGCVATSAVPGVLATNLNPADIRNGQTIGGVTGSFSGAGALANCDGSSVHNCTANPSYPAMEQAGAADKILAGQTLGGETGNVVLPAANKVLSGTSFGVLAGDSGTVADCSSNGDDDCYLNSADSFDAADLTNLSAGNIKSGVTIAGTAGDYPSSSYPLPSASATSDLDNATFNAKIKSSSTFEYWTSEGVYQTSAGNDDIIASNIKAGVTVFGTTGTYTDLLFPPVSFSSIATTTTQIDHSWSQ